MPEVLSDIPSLEEVLWNFSHFKDKKCRLTLRENPHFYAELPTLREAYGDEFRIDPTEDFRHANEFYVLADKPELVHIMTDRISQSFGNFWCPKDDIIFKGLGILFLFFHPLMSFQTPVGGLEEKASSRRLSEAYSVGSVGGSRCIPTLFPVLPGIIVDYSQLSQRSARG